MKLPATYAERMASLAPSLRPRVDLALDKARQQRLAVSHRLALDRSSARSIDVDGHLHVSSSVISSAAVNGYAGREIPDYEELGLQPDRIYQLFRSPQELEKAAPTFAGKPLLVEHRPQSSDAHSHELTVGAISNPVWDAPNLRASLTIWDQNAIEAVQDGSKSALSCGYRFRCVVEPGVYLGQRYDAQMVDLVGNHVALCAEPRVAGAQVGDSLTRKQDMSETTSTGEDEYGNLLEFLATKLEPGDLETAKQMLGCGDPDLMAGDDPPPFSGRPQVGGGMDPITRNAVAQDAINRARKKQADDFYARHPGAARLRNAR
jgi:hypothetical protein